MSCTGDSDKSKMRNLLCYVMLCYVMLCYVIKLIKHVSQSRNNTQFYVQKVI
jgi:hypothetical protein